MRQGIRAVKFWSPAFSIWSLFFYDIDDAVLAFGLLVSFAL